MLQRRANTPPLDICSLFSSHFFHLLYFNHFVCLLSLLAACLCAVTKSIHTFTNKSHPHPFHPPTGSHYTPLHSFPITLPSDALSFGLVKYFLLSIFAYSLSLFASLAHSFKSLPNAYPASPLPLLVSHLSTSYSLSFLLSPFMFFLRCEFVLWDSHFDCLLANVGCSKKRHKSKQILVTVKLLKSFYGGVLPCLSYAAPSPRQRTFLLHFSSLYTTRHSLMCLLFATFICIIKSIWICYLLCCCLQLCPSLSLLCILQLV